MYNYIMKCGGVFMKKISLFLIALIMIQTFTTNTVKQPRDLNYLCQSQKEQKDLNYLCKVGKEVRDLNYLC